MQDLGMLPGLTFSAAYGVSDDGSVVVGDGGGYPARTRAFRWTPSEGMQDLGALPGWTDVYARAVSPDGSTVVGFASTPSGTRAFRWTQSGGMHELGAGYAAAASADGSVVVGYGSSGAFRWTQSGGMQPLGVLPGASGSVAYDVSADGSMVVGYVYTPGVNQAVRWTIKQTPAPFAFSGFFAPLNNLPTQNLMKAGAAAPVKFNLGGDKGLDIFAPGAPTSRAVSCSTLAPTQEGQVTVTAGHSTLNYDPANGQYTYVWKTDKAWAGTCREFSIKLSDDTEHKALFRFTK
jgi:probable HAF family extracellular repeat protein